MARRAGAGRAARIPGLLCVLAAAVAGGLLWTLPRAAFALGVEGLELRVGAPTFLPRGRVWRVRVEVRNAGSAPFVGPLALAVESGSLPLAGRARFTGNGRPWVPVWPPRGGVLGPGASARPVFLRFPGRPDAPPRFKARIIERPGAAPPAVTLEGPAPGATVLASPVLVTGTRRPEVRRIVVNGTPATLSGGRWAVRVSLPEGAARLRLRAADARGRRLTALAWGVRVDTRPPVLELRRPAPGARIRHSSVKLRVRIRNESAVTATVNGEPVPVQGDDLRARVPVPVGRSLVRIVVRDVHGRESTLEVPVERLPAPSIVSGPPPVAREGEPWRHVLRAVPPPGAGAVRFRLREAPPGLSMRRPKGARGEVILSWTPPAGGEYPVRVRIGARGGGKEDHLLVVRVLPGAPPSVQGRIDYRYDEAGRLVEADGHDLPPVRWQHDARGNVVVRSAP